VTLASAERAEGRLELRRRGEAEVVITLGGRVLMNGAAHRSEAALAELACRPIAARPLPRVLLGGLGMGYTLRAALDVLPRRAAVIVAEIDPLIVEWCRGPLAELTGRALDDPRVDVEVCDVAALIAGAAIASRPRATGETPHAGSGFDAILLDLYEGPRTPAQGRDDPLYGRAALARAHAALAPGGVLAVWSEDTDAGFEARLGAAGFRWERRRPGRGGPRHILYLARRERRRRGGLTADPEPAAGGKRRTAGSEPRASAVPRRTSRAGRDRPAPRRRRRGPT
jgi:spermidine synthase